ncbi:MAG: hypothetical protein HZB80_11660 [Deltaproteobacteria bacterium]|nr:hypothetical protein [Deltaproteobacteria bacterium]
MEKMRRFKKTMIGIYAIMMMFMLFPMNNAANSATRQENMQKIENFLSNDAVNRGISEKGETYERVMRNIGMMSDAQVEKLAEYANAQTVQVGGEIKDSGEDFWTFYKWYLIATLGITLLLILMI